MRKIPEEYENPIDNVFYIFVIILAPFLNKLGITPNMVTTAGNIFFIIALYFIYKQQNLILCIILILLSYYSDCLDGYIARKYNMTTIIGDYYDHISDNVRLLILFYILYRINPKLFLNWVPFILLFIIAISIHFFYQENLFNKKNSSPTLTFLTKIYSYHLNTSKKSAIKALKYTKYFGSGSFIIFICIFILVIVKSSNSIK